MDFMLLEQIPCPGVSETTGLSCMIHVWLNIQSISLLLIILGIYNSGLEGLRHRHLWPTVVWWSDLVIITTILVCWDYKKVFHYAKLCQCFPISINVKPAEKLTRTSEQPLPSKKFYFLMHRNISRVGGGICYVPNQLVFEAVMYYYWGKKIQLYVW